MNCATSAFSKNYPPGSCPPQEPGACVHIGLMVMYQEMWKIMIPPTPEIHYFSNVSKY